MSRPKVSLQNYEAVYDFYEQHRQSQLFARLGHAVMSKIYRPQISYAEDGGAEDAIREEFSAGTRLVISPNHLTEHDQYAIVAAVQSERALHSLRGNTFIPAKASLFTQPRNKGGQVLRRAVDGLGAIPIYRLEDMKREPKDGTTDRKELYRAALLRISDISVTKLVDQGSHMAAFLEGTRNRTDHRIVQPLKKGVAQTVCEAAGLVNVSILPMGLYYGGEPVDYRKGDVPNKFTPTLHIGSPLRIETSSPEELASMVHPAIQACVDMAVHLSSGS